MKYWFLFLMVNLFASDYAIVFVHLGPKLPDYAPLSFSQARLFNPECPIYLIANEEALREFPHRTVTPVPCESLSRSGPHEQFLREVQTNGFWQYVTERFYYLEELMSQHQLQNVFHLENDVMLYRDLRELLPTFQKNYPGMIASTFDNDSRCVAGFMYIAEARPLSQFVQFATGKILRADNDMYLLGQFREKFYKQYIDHLPIINPLYAQENPLESSTGKIARNPTDYTNHFDEFLSVFDAAAFGQYLGGLDPMHRDHEPGFISESCLFNPSHLTIIWKRDAQGRQVPIANYKSVSHPINNLHIHCKNLALFSSLCTEPNPTIAAPPPIEKVIYPLSNDPIDAVIYATEKNQVTLELCIQGLRTYVKNIGRIVIISERAITDQGEWFDEKRFPFSKTSILEELFSSDPYERRRYGYRPRNQLGAIFTCLARLYAPLVIPDLSPNLLLIEPEVIFTNPIALIDDEGRTLFNARGKRVQTFSALPGPLKEIDHFALLQKPIHEDLFQHLKARYQKEPWRAICNKIDTQKLYEPCLSDFCLYGNFALLRTEQAYTKPQKWAPISGLYALPKHQKEGCIYVRYQLYRQDQR
ncbi:MAG TPA: hypothetical protein VLF94_09065 [Chlamydiales bacterium]|nr:hypothetical protein [Chlamydiales bacterium]